MMNHWIIAPIVLPAFVAAAMVLWMRHDIVLQRVFSLGATSAAFAIALMLMVFASDGGIEVYRLGDWPAPFGIVLVLDRLSALMVLLTALLALIVLLYVIGSGWDRRGPHFHALFQFQIMGISGAFLTGDAFNLFVFFEVMLIASYGLMIHAGGGQRIRAGVQYVVLNLAGSTLFLFALGTLYGVAGTLNMADLALKVASLPEGDQALLRVGATLLILVFAIKAALVPLQFWLPGTYANAPGPVAALFAIMTKVGAYAIIRMFTLVFPTDSAVTGSMFADVLMPLALITLGIGAIGVLGADRLGRLIAFAVIASMGTLFVAVALFTPAGITAALYYLAHSTFAGAALFLILDLVRERRGRAGDRLRAAPPLEQHGLIAAFFFAAAVAMVGMPPLSGFIGKLLVLDATRAAPMAVAIWATILIASLVMLVGFARAGSVVFWKPAPPPKDMEPARAPAPSDALALGAVGAVLAIMVALTVFAGPVNTYMTGISAQLFDTAPYIAAVLPSSEGVQ
jgi:multicomponent K+:H+ antiporter subunit D